jgi:hypothetical protein
MFRARDQNAVIPIGFCSARAGPVDTIFSGLMSKDNEMR